MTNPHTALRPWDQDYEPNGRHRTAPKDPAERTPQPERPAPEPGADVVLATLSRGERGDLVVRLRWYESNPYLDVRIFVGGRPTSKGTSIRLRELTDIRQAFDRAEALILNGGER